MSLRHLLGHAHNLLVPSKGLILVLSLISSNSLSALRRFTASSPFSPDRVSSTIAFVVRHIESRVVAIKHHAERLEIGELLV